MRIILTALLSCLFAPDAQAVQRQGTAFTIHVTFSPRAQAAMTRRNEALTIAAYYEGEPNAAGRRHVNEEGTISLGVDRLTVPARPGPVTITGRGLRRARLAWIRAGTARVNVNLFSARRSGPDNILDCGIVDGSLAEVTGRSFRVRCKLIGEP